MNLTSSNTVLRVKHLKPTSYTAIMTTFVVIDAHGKQVGLGYVIWKDGVLREPTLVSNDGEELPAQWYTLVAVDQQLVVAPEEKQ